MAAINLAQVQPELKQHVIGSDEIALSTAIANTKIVNSSINEIKEVLRLVMIKIGLRSQNWPSEEEKIVLIDHILKNFGGHTCEEIRLAFDMAMAGKLYEYNLKGEQVPVSANCYENFSCLYFSGIMTAYRMWASQAYNHLPQNKESLLLEENKTITDEEMQEWIEDWVGKRRDLLLIPNSFYDWLVAKEKIVLSNKEKRELLERAVQIREMFLIDQIKNEGETSKYFKQFTEFKKMKHKKEFDGEEVLKLKEIAKKIAVSDYLRSQQVTNEVSTTPEG